MTLREREAGVRPRSRGGEERAAQGERDALVVVEDVALRLVERREEALLEVVQASAELALEA